LKAPWSVDFKNTTALRGIGDALLAQNNYGRALSFYQAALMQTPEDFGSLLGKAKALYSLQRYASSLQAFDLALKKEPESIQAMTGKGRLCSGKAAGRGPGGF